MAEKKAPACSEKLDLLRQIVTCAKDVTRRIRTYFPVREQGWNLADRSEWVPVLNQVVNAQVRLEHALTPPAMPNCKPERGSKMAVFYTVGPGWPEDFYLAVKRVLNCHDALLEQCGWKARVIYGDTHGYRWDWAEPSDSPIPAEQLDALEKARPHLNALDQAADHLNWLIDPTAEPPKPLAPPQDATEQLRDWMTYQEARRVLKCVSSTVGDYVKKGRLFGNNKQGKRARVCAASVARLALELSNKVLQGRGQAVDSADHEAGPPADAIPERLSSFQQAERLRRKADNSP
jgi:hypothetical protein